MLPCARRERVKEAVGVKRDRYQSQKKQFPLARTDTIASKEYHTLWELCFFSPHKITISSTAATRSSWPFSSLYRAWAAQLNLPHSVLRVRKPVARIQIISSRECHNLDIVRLGKFIGVKGIRKKSQLDKPSLISKNEKREMMRAKAAIKAAWLR